MKKFALILLAVLTVPVAANAQDTARFCAEVAAQKQSCQTKRVDCSFMMKDVDAKTLDTIDMIKGCGPTAADPSVLQSPQYPELGTLVCCMGNGIR